MSDLLVDEAARRVHYGVALGLLLVAYVLDALNGAVVDMLVALIFVLVLGVVLFGPGTPRSLRVVGAGLGTLVVVGATTATVFDLTDTPRGVVQLATTLLLVVVLVAVILGVVRGEVVTISVVMGAVMAYALLSFIAASVYHGVDLLTDAPFFAQGAVPRSDYLYFSFITLTTVGFGDLTPGTDLAERLVVVESFVGQMFLVVLIARLVSLWGRQRPAPFGRRVARKREAPG